MRLLSAEHYGALINGAALLRADRFGPNVYETVDGRIVESGSHAELLQQGGIYKRLWDYQSGGFLAPD